MRVRRGAGEELRVELRCPPGGTAVPAPSVTSAERSWRMLDGGVGYFRPGSFSPPLDSGWGGAAPAEREAILAADYAQLRSVFTDLEDAAALVLDLRGNPGGTDLLGQALVGHLLEPGFVYFQLSARTEPKGLLALIARPRWRAPIAYRPDVSGSLPRLACPVVCLIDAGTFSTADNVAACLRDVHPDITFVGRPNGAGTGAPRAITLPASGASVAFCTQRVHAPGGALIEGASAVPDVVVRPTRDDLLRGRDADLAAALQVIADRSIDPRFAAVDATLQRWVERERVAGVVGLVEQDGRVVYRAAHGLRDVDAARPMRDDTIFRIYSMSKPITCAAALVLVDRGALRLDDPVARYLPEFAELEVGVEQRDPASGETTLRRVPVQRPMTVRDLMRHTSGLTYGYFADSAVDTLVRRANPLGGGRDLQGMVEVLASIPLKHQPGQAWEYGLSTDVLGRVVEVASGESLDAFFAAALFEPLGMVDTGFQVPAAAAHRVATLYQGGSELERRPAPPPTVRPRLLSGGGGLFSTAADYARFCRMLLGGGVLDGHRVLRPETVAAMCSDQLGALELSGTAAALVRGRGFGLGGTVVTEPGRSGAGVGTYGWGGAAGTLFWVDRESDVIGVFMVQSWMQLTYGGVFQAAVHRALSR